MYEDELAEEWYSIHNPEAWRAAILYLEAGVPVDWTIIDCLDATDKATSDLYKVFLGTQEI